MKLCLLGSYAVWLLFLRSVRRLLVTASVVPSSPILVTLMKEALSSSETLQEPHDVTSPKTPFFIGICWCLVIRMGAVRRCVTVQIFGNDSKKSKFDTLGR
jgi:hypothetical protein